MLEVNGTDDSVAVTNLDLHALTKLTLAQQIKPAALNYRPRSEPKSGAAADDAFSS